MFSILKKSFRSKTYCGGNGVVTENYDISPISGNVLKLSFQSGILGHRGAVWIYYESKYILSVNVILA